MIIRKLKNLLVGSTQQIVNLFRRNNSEVGKIAVIGGGSWATALAKVIVEQTGHIGWYMRRQDRIDSIKQTGRNAAYLTDVVFDVSKLYLSTDLNEIIRKYDTLVFVTPSPYIKEHLQKVTESMQNKFIVVATKGIVPGENMTITDYFRFHYSIEEEQIACLLGPSHAEEVAKNQLTYLTVGCTNIEKAHKLADTIQSEKLQIRVSDDVTGMEYASTLKNIYALGAGICHGLKFGDNFHAVYMANAASEMVDVLNLLAHADERNIACSAYLGDLLVTGYSDFSRNRMFGTMIGRGTPVKQALTEMQQISEGYYASQCMHNIIEQYKGFSFPILNVVYSILYEGANPEVEFKKLTLLFK